MTSARIESIQIGRVQKLGEREAKSPHDREWETAFFKTPVKGPHAIDANGFGGDEVADKKNHGGIDKAVLCYSIDHRPAWSSEVPELDTSSGAFGENLSLAGITEGDVCIGDVWHAGEVQLEVSQPRQPCWKMGRRHRMSDLPKRVVKNGRSGWYVRVKASGTLTAGDELVLVERPHPQWTILEASRLLYQKDIPLNDIRALASVPQLAAAWRTALGVSD